MTPRKYPPRLTQRARQLIQDYDRPLPTAAALELVAAVEASARIEKRVAEVERRSSGGTRTRAGRRRAPSLGAGEIDQALDRFLGKVATGEQNHGDQP